MMPTERMTAEQYRTLKNRKRPAYVHGKMNGAERAFAAILEGRRLAGEIKLWEFEPRVFLLDKTTTYTPDFVIVDIAGYCGREIAIEIKGRLRDDAAVKFKWARQRFPDYLWEMWRAKKRGGQWMFEKMRI